jgi:hypothetical protein
MAEGDVFKYGRTPVTTALPLLLGRREGCCCVKHNLRALVTSRNQAFHRHWLIAFCHQQDHLHLW